MKEIVILSGKGGTGKTSIAAALASVAENAVICDSDVDAADLHLLLHPEKKEEHAFSGGWIVQINSAACTKCRFCMDVCRYGAIRFNRSGQLEINPFQCEGCRLCERKCPAQAITSIRNDSNFWYVSETRFGKMVHAKMSPGEDNSGKLVTQIRSRAKEIANEDNISYIINDGPPGIGCATISSLTGSQAVLIVAEPSKSGLHDLERLVELVSKFSIPAYAIINKYDIDLQLSSEIEAYLEKNSIPLLDKIPFTKDIVKAMVEGKTITEFNKDSDITNSIIRIWEKIK